MKGRFSFDNLKVGIIYDLEGDNRKIYNGKINDKGEKNDENAEIYENENKIFNGTIKNNILLNGRMIVLKKGENGTEKEEAYYFERKDDKKDDEEINFDYRKGEEKDDELIKKMKDIFDIYDCEQLKDLYMKALEIREKVLSPENFFLFLLILVFLNFHLIVLKDHVNKQNLDLVFFRIFLCQN